MIFKNLFTAFCVEDGQRERGGHQYEERDEDAEEKVSCVTRHVHVRDSEAVIGPAIVTREDGVRHAVSLKPFVTTHLHFRDLNIYKN